MTPVIFMIYDPSVKERIKYVYYDRSFHEWCACVCTEHMYNSIPANKISVSATTLLSCVTINSFLLFIIVFRLFGFTHLLAFEAET